MKDKLWTVYLVMCSDDSFYCGITNKEVQERIRTHNRGRGAKYTKGRLPVSLLGCKGGFTKSEALKLEYKIKQLTKDKKLPMLDK